jgi:small subunit ribosomal protein S16
MLTLRLAGAGSRGKRKFVLVAADKRARRDGKYIEKLGYFDPAHDVLVFKQDRVDYWLAKGATVSETAMHLIKRVKTAGNKVLTPKAKYIAPPAKPVEPKAPKAAPAAEAPAADAPAAQ